MNRRIIASLLAATLTVIAPGVQAHHSVAQFDTNHFVDVTGTVKSFLWENPHCFIYMMVPNDKSSLDEWEVEGPAVVTLARQGWRATTLQPGAKITVTLAPRRDGAHGGSFFKVTLTDGTILGSGRAGIVTVPAAGGHL